MTNQPNLTEVDWSKIPPPPNDGAADQLLRAKLARIALTATDGRSVTLADLPGRTVLYAYPRTGQPGQALPDGWDMIPGARGCTPQSCAFRDHFAELKAAGAAHVYGVSTLDSAYQREAAQRLHLPFALLSDADLAFTSAMRLPTMQVDGMTLLKRMALVVDDGTIVKVFYPVFPPDRNAGDVLRWLQANPRT